MLLSKYADRLTLYRQSQIFKRKGLDLDQSPPTDWMGKITTLPEPLADAIGRHVLSAEVIFDDNMPICMLAPGTGKAQAARLWTCARDERPSGRRASVSVRHWARTNGASMAHYRFSGDCTGQHSKDHFARCCG